MEVWWILYVRMARESYLHKLNFTDQLLRTREITLYSHRQLVNTEQIQESYVHAISVLLIITNQANQLFPFSLISYAAKTFSV